MGKAMSSARVGKRECGSSECCVFILRELRHDMGCRKRPPYLDYAKLCNLIPRASIFNQVCPACSFDSFPRDVVCDDSCTPGVTSDELDDTEQ
jgi:hypothetical protein